MSSTSVNVYYQNRLFHKTSKTIMKQLRLVLVFMFLLVTIPAVFAQKRTVSGKISDANGKPLPFVNVTVKGTSVGTTSNSDGVYSISVPQGSNTLVFSFIGYKVNEVDISNRTTVDVSMQEDAGELGGVVV